MYTKYILLREFQLLFANANMFAFVGACQGIQFRGREECRDPSIREQTQSAKTAREQAHIQFIRILLSTYIALDYGINI